MFVMAVRPKCGWEFPSTDMWTEVFEAKESQTGRTLGN